MVSGFFRVEFSAAAPGAGGIVAVEDGRVRGTDGSYLYSGTFVESGGTAKATLRVSPMAPSARSVFGSIGQSFDLTLTGQIDAAGFRFSGASPMGFGPPITISGTRVANIDLH